MPPPHPSQGAERAPTQTQTVVSKLKPGRLTEEVDSVPPSPALFYHLDHKGPSASPLERTQCPAVRESFPHAAGACSGCMKRVSAAGEIHPQGSNWQTQPEQPRGRVGLHAQMQETDTGPGKGRGPRNEEMGMHRCH